MGDRGNIAILQPDTSPPEFVVLYTHWTGSEIPETLREAINNACNRADDAQYFARIAFDTLTKDHHGGVTGYGITTKVWDNGHPIVVVDCDNQEVYTVDQKDLSRPTSAKIKFARYAALPHANWGTFSKE